MKLFDEFCGEANVGMDDPEIAAEMAAADRKYKTAILAAAKVREPHLLCISDALGVHIYENVSDFEDWDSFKALLRGTAIAVADMLVSAEGYQATAAFLAEVLVDCLT